MKASRRQFLATSAALASIAPMGAWSQNAAKLTLQAAWVNDAEFMGYFIAMDKGFYKAEGLVVTYLSGGPDVIPEASLLSKKADVCLTTVETAIKAITDQKAPLVIIGAQYQKNPVGIVSLASKPLKTPQRHHRLRTMARRMPLSAASSMSTPSAAIFWRWPNA